MFSYAEEASESDEVIKKLVTGENAPINRVYKPEFVTLAPPLLNCQDEVSTRYFYFFIIRFSYCTSIFFFYNTVNNCEQNILLQK